MENEIYDDVFDRRIKILRKLEKETYVENQEDERKEKKEKNKYLKIMEIAYCFGTSGKNIRSDIDFLKKFYPIVTHTGRYGGVGLRRDVYDLFIPILSAKEIEIIHKYTEKERKTNKVIKKLEVCGQITGTISAIIDDKTGSAEAMWIRRLRVIAIMSSNKYMTGAGLANILGISSKTIYRDIQYLTRDYDIAYRADMPNAGFEWRNANLMSDMVGAGFWEMLREISERIENKKDKEVIANIIKKYGGK